MNVVNKGNKMETKITKKCLKIGIIGVTGKVGSVLASTIERDPYCTLTGGTNSRSTAADFEKLAHSSDIFIDFSSPQSTLMAVEAAKFARIPFVCGTTGISPDIFHRVEQCSSDIAILYASNFSITIHLISLLLPKIAKTLVDYDVTIVDKHHKNKKDAPSGTSIFLAKQIDCNINMLSIREGNIPAEVICEFCGNDDMLTISHRAFNRAVFAKGALSCGKWLAQNSTIPGMYNMQNYMEYVCKQFSTDK